MIRTARERADHPGGFPEGQIYPQATFRTAFQVAWGKPSARVRVCEDPVLGGVSEALKSIHLSDIVERYKGMTDFFILCVDRDGDVSRRERLDQIEAEFTEQNFLAENAWEELETWTLAGLSLPPKMALV